MRKLGILTLAILMLCSGLKAQQLSIYINSLNGVLAGNNLNTGSRGGSFGVNYLHPIAGNLKMLGGLELNTVSWGNNFNANIGIVYEKEFAPKWSWSVTGLTQQGIVLFKPNPLYSFGLSALGGIEYKISEKSSIGLNTGLLWYSCPVYNKYSLISSYLDVPLELSYRIRLDK